MQTAAQYLEGLTQSYWMISSVWNGKINTVLETGQAITMCTDVIYSVNPARPLVKAMQGLQDEIVSGSGVRRSAKILPLPIKQA